MAQSDFAYTLDAVLAIMLLFMFAENLLVLIIQGGKGIKAGTKPPEDRLPNQPLPNPSDKDKDDDFRWRRIVQNHNETVPFAFLLFIISDVTLRVFGNGDSREALIIIIILYVFFRFLWCFCYVWAIQPFRSIFWGCSIFCVFGGALIGVIAAFKMADTGEPLPS